MDKGLYQHYKGQFYLVDKIVKHSETEEDLVLYQCQYGDYSWWVRPLAMFLEEVEVDGTLVSRFKKISD